MAVKKKPISPRQRMINLMYIVLMAMLALNVSSDVLKGFSLVGDSLNRTTANAMQENQTLYDNFAEKLEQNPAKVRPWYDKAMMVKEMSDSLYDFAEQLRWALAREVDGKDGNPDNLENKEDLNASNIVMLSRYNGKGQQLHDKIVAYRDTMMSFITDPREKAIIASNLSTDVPKSEDNLGKDWKQYMFEEMPTIASITMLSKLQNDVRNTEGEVLRVLADNIDIKDIRVNELNAYVLPEATTLYPGQTFKSQIFMAAVDTTQRPEIYVNGKRLTTDGSYEFTVPGPGEYTFNGYIQMPNAAGEIIRRDFTQRYNVIAPPLGATVAADLMNVLYAGFDNPVSVSASGVPANKVSLSMTGGTLTAQGNGKYVARPAKIGEPVTFSVSGVVNGRTQSMGTYTFKVRKLPDPTAYINLGGDVFRGGRLPKSTILGLSNLSAAIDDGLLNIPFRVLGFEAVFFDRMGNTVISVSHTAGITDLHTAKRVLLAFCTDVDVIVFGAVISSRDSRVGNENTLRAVLENDLGERRRLIVDTANAGNADEALLIDIVCHKADLIHVSRKHQLLRLFALTLFERDQVAERVGIYFIHIRSDFCRQNRGNISFITGNTDGHNDFFELCKHDDLHLS